MKTIHDVEDMVIDYMKRHNLKYKILTRLDDVVEVECFDLTTLEAKLTKNGRVSFKIDGKRASIKK